MIIKLKRYSDEWSCRSGLDVNDLLESTKDTVLDTAEYVQDHLPETRFRKVVNQYKNWWKRSKKQEQNNKKKS